VSIAGCRFGEYRSDRAGVAPVFVLQLSACAPG